MIFEVLIAFFEICLKIVRCPSFLTFGPGRAGRARRPKCHFFEIQDFLEMIALRVLTTRFHDFWGAYCIFWDFFEKNRCPSVLTFGPGRAGRAGRPKCHFFEIQDFLEITALRELTTWFKCQWGAYCIFRVLFENFFDVRQFWHLGPGGPGGRNVISLKFRISLKLLPYGS